VRATKKGDADGDLLTSKWRVYDVLKAAGDAELERHPLLRTLLGRLLYYGLVYPLGFILDGFLMISLRLGGDLRRLLRDRTKMEETTKARAIAIIVDKVAGLASFALIGACFGPKALAYIVLSQLFYRGFLFHPCLTFWVTTHKSHDVEGDCQPTSSVYSAFATLICAGVNYHVEHHDFPAIPVTRLWRLRKIAREYYIDIPHYTGVLQVYRDLITSNDWVYGCHDQLLNRGQRSTPPTETVLKPA
jgi:fatty acid desaturase